MNSQHSSSVAFKRFAKTTTADITKIREDRHEQATKTATKWAVNAFEGKRSKPYSKQAYIGLRAGIQRHLSDSPWFIQYALVSDPAFKESNDTMCGVFKWLAKQGLDTVQHHDLIEKQDIDKMKATNVIGTDNPVSLQRLV